MSLLRFKFAIAKIRSIRTNTNDATLKLTMAKLKNAIELMPEKSALVVKIL